ncbi:MAG: PEP-CTERM sorting domain-containing protein [Betaproteobacteria bacterium]
MKWSLSAGVLALAAAGFAAGANAASYSTSYVAGDAVAGSVAGSGDTAALVAVGDSLTVTFSAPTGAAFVTHGDYLFDWQQLADSGTALSLDVTYAFTLDGVDVGTGTVTGAFACCSDIRLPVFNSPDGAWNQLVYTATIASGDAARQLDNRFNYYQANATYTSTGVVPEPASIGLLLAGLALLAASSRRGKR